MWCYNGCVILLKIHVYKCPFSCVYLNGGGRITDDLACYLIWSYIRPLCDATSSDDVLILPYKIHVWYLCPYAAFDEFDAWLDKIHALKILIDTCEDLHWWYDVCPYLHRWNVTMRWTYVIPYKLIRTLDDACIVTCVLVICLPVIKMCPTACDDVIRCWPMMIRHTWVDPT